MSKTDDKTREVCGQQFTIVKNGLDEADVSSFIDGLTAEHSELGQQLQDVDSLMASAENLIVEAGKRAKELATQVEEDARAKVDSVIAEAEETARAEAEKMFDNVRAEAHAETERVREEAEQLRISCRERIAAEMRAAFEAVCADLLGHQDNGETPTLGVSIAPADADTADSVDPGARPAASVEDMEDPIIGPEPPARPVSDEQESSVALMTETEESTVTQAEDRATEDEVHAEAAQDDLYQGQVQLRIMPPLSLDGVVRVHRELKTNPQVEVKSFAVSAEEGVTVEVNLPAAMPFEHFLRSLPDVADVASTSEHGSKGRGRRKAAPSSTPVFEVSLAQS